MHSFKSIEHTSLTNLAQTCINTGARWGKVNVNGIQFGRKSTRDECFNKFIFYKKKIKNEIKIYSKDHTLSTTVDLWRDDHVARYYLDFTIL